MTAAVLSLLLSCIEPEAIPLVGHACGGTKEGMCHATGTMCVCASLVCRLGMEMYDLHCILSVEDMQKMPSRTELFPADWSH